MYSAERAKEAGIIDDVQFRQDFVAGLKAKYGDDVVFDKKYGKKKSMDIDLSSPFGILKFYGDLLAGSEEEAGQRVVGGHRVCRRPDHARSERPQRFPAVDGRRGLQHADRQGVG